MYRLEALSRLIWRSVPEAAADPFGVITALGSATFLLFALSLLYWEDDRRSTATVVSYAFLGLAVVITLKTAFALPRPPESVRLIPLENDPYGFPSGHAVAAVVVYGGLLAVRDRLDWRAILGGGLLIGLIGLSRVVLGMHYVGDVLVGTLLGLVVLATAWRFIGDEPARGFALAALVAAVALVVSSLSEEALLAFGGSVGGTVGSLQLDALTELRSRLEGFVLTGLGVPFVFLVDGLAEGVGHPALVVFAYAVLVAGILLLPALVGRLPLSVVRRPAS